MTAPDGFPWREVMGVALGVLRWTPEAFWRATPREFAGAVEGLRGRGPEPASRDDLRRLMEAFPDNGDGHAG